MTQRSTKVWPISISVAISARLEAAVLEASRSAGRTPVRSLQYSSVQPKAARAAATAGHGDRQPLLGQVADQGAEALALGAEAGSRPGPRTSLKNSSAVSWACMPILSRLRPRSKPAMPRSTISSDMPLWRWRRVGLHRGDHEVGVDAVGDEGLRAVDHVVVAVADGRGGHAGQVGADAGLGHGDGGDQLARADAREPALLLLVGARVRGSTAGRRRCGARCPWPAALTPASLDLLGDDLVVAEVVDPAAAVAPRGTSMPRKPASPAFRNTGGR